MKGYWYVPAMACLCSALTRVFDSSIFFIALLVWSVYLYSSNRLGKIPFFISLATFLFFFIYIPQIELNTTINTQEKKTLIGEIVSPISTSETVLQFDFQESNTKNILKVLYYNPETTNPNYLSIQLGANCQLVGEVRIPEESTNPGQFNYQKYLAASGIQFEVEVESFNDISCQGKTNWNWIYKLRDSIKEYVLITYSEKTSSWINALVLGDDSLISKDTTELFQRWGLSHLLAISGLHIGLVVGLLFMITVKFGLLTREKYHYVIIIFLPIYAILAGGEPSVLRACSMVILVILIRKIRLKLSVTDVISVTFLLLIAMDKYIIYHVGFQLSFIVTFGIILSRKWISEDNSLFFQMLKLSFISQLMIIPLQIIYFFQFNPLSIVLNVLVVPYFSFFVIPLMFILIIVFPIPLVPELVDKLFSTIHDVFFLVPLEYIDQFAFYPWITGRFPSILIVVYYSLLVLMMNSIHRQNNRKAFGYGVILTALLFSLLIRPYLSPYGTVTMLDIGQGDAIVIEFPYRKGVVLIDSGANFSFDDFEPSDSIYKRIIKPFLQYQGINKIDVVFISHEDIDHVGSIPYILEDFNVERVITSKFFEYDFHLESRPNLLQVEAGQNVDIKGNRFTILSPWVDKNNSNENSLVLHADIGNFSWLFTGDIHVNNEQEILNRFQNLAVDVLKVAHHGSETSSNPEFVSRINPTFALISVGRENRYGHPSRNVIETFNQEDVTIMRTDQDGAIIYRYTEKNGTFYPFKP